VNENESPRLRLEFKKKTDGGAAIRYVRADGSSTWTSSNTASGRGATVRFFVAHDLGHYAAETTLGLDQAFLGLLADGWELTDFGSPWPKGKFHPSDLPQLMLAEFVAGALDRELASGEPVGASELNRTIAVEWAKYGDGSQPVVDCEQLARARACRQELLCRWEELAPGETLSLSF
jgi:hypothetical protein